MNLKDTHGPASVRLRSQCSKIFSETAWPIKAKFYVEPPLGRGGGDILFAASVLHDQDGRHAHIC